MDPGVHQLTRAAQITWPTHRWSQARAHRGAFHLVLVSPDGVAVRATSGGRGEERAHREALLLRTIRTLSLGVEIPDLVDGPRRLLDSDAWMTLVSVVAGQPTGDLAGLGRSRIRAYADILRSMDESTAATTDLPPARSWCGGPRWPEIVHDMGALLEPHARSVARDRVDDLLSSEAAATKTLCHGDFGPHNILWRQDAAVSLLDWDHACLGDPAIDIAPLIGWHGAAAMAPICSLAVLRRAMIHRACLALQVASAAHLAGLAGLRDHALANFTRRVRAGTLFDPGGLTPSSN